MWQHVESGRIFYNWDQLRIWLVQLHNIARPEDAADLPEILAGLGVTVYVQPEQGPQPQTPEQIILDLTAELELHYDIVAQRRRYDNRLTCALRAGYAGPFQAEGTAFAIWMDTCNAYAYQVMAAVLAEERSIPTSAGLISELPAPPW